jgi:major vault protein
MAREEDRVIQRETELVLPPGVFAFVLDSTKGNINTYCGPIKQSLSNTDQLVVYDAGVSRFLPASNISQAIQTNVTAPKGYYVVLRNPSRDGRHPEPGKAEIMSPSFLKIGEVENLPGPQSFPLWPIQIAEVVLGHQLRSNQYLLVRIHDEEAARAHWGQGIIKLAEPTSGGKVATSGGTGSLLEIDPASLFTGQILLIQGTEVSFYIPPTGIEVLPEADPDDGARSGGRGGPAPAHYVREAVTLERLEYCILLDESGEKRYVIGPKVVFPSPTEQFVTRDGRRKFRAYELTEISGLHVKIIADYRDADGTEHRAGDEIFITGKVQAIYYPRPEHAIVSYGDRDIYYAIAIPTGEARYVLNRKSGEIRLLRGPAVFLPNPVDEVVVRRILTDRECELYYPGNPVVLETNRTLRGPRPGEGGIREAAAAPRALAMQAPAQAEAAGESTFGDTMRRGGRYTPPRTITLDTRYEGAVTVDVWSGYAVQVVNRKGERKVVEGPRTVLLEYDEILEHTTLSTGVPKDPERLLKTVYLRIRSNAVTDRLALETLDLVPVTIEIKYLVRFEGDPQRWFDVDNYVQYLCDHLRSLIGNAVRGIRVLSFYFAAASFLRDLILGAKGEGGERPLRRFAENGMVIYDLEIIRVAIDDARINELLHQSQQEDLLNTIELDRQRRLQELTAGQEAARRVIEEERAATQRLLEGLKVAAAEAAARLAQQELADRIERDRLRVEGERTAQEVLSQTVALRLADHKADRDLAEQYALGELQRRTTELAAEAEAAVKRLGAVQPGLVEALTAVAQAGTLESLAEHLAPLSLVRDQSLAGTLEQVFAGTPLAGMLENLRRLGKGAILGTDTHAGPHPAPGATSVPMASPPGADSERKPEK